jgi:integrase/recombinase XerD
MRVSLFIREHGTRRYRSENPKTLYPAGTIYVLRYTLKGKRIWETLPTGTTHHSAKVLAMEKECAFLKGEAITPLFKPKPTLVPKPAFPASALMLDAAIDRYKESLTRRRKSEKTINGYGYTLKEFFKAVGNKPLADVKVQDLEQFVAYMNEQELSDRTVSNRIVEVVTLLRYFGIKGVTLTVKYVEKAVRAYRPDELKRLFDAATPAEWLLFQFFLGTGARDQEVQFARWSDMNFVDGIYTVTAHLPEFTPKDHEEREIPLPSHLLAAMAERQKSATSELIFPTPAGGADRHMLRKLKALAKRAGVDPNICILHRFRKTYATLLHRAGVDARTIQRRLGHSDLQTTLLYLEGESARSIQSREKADQAFGVFSGGTQTATV